MLNQLNLPIDDCPDNSSEDKTGEVMTPISTNLLSPKLKPHRSAKNLHELKNIETHPTSHLIPPLQLTSRKMDAWEQERKELMTSLTVLKESAVTLLAQKDCALEHMKVQ